MSDSDGMMMKLHYAVGTGAGQVTDGTGREIPVCVLHFAKNEEIIEQMEAGIAEYDPDDSENWMAIALTVNAARNLLKDLPTMIEEAIKGPPLDDNEGEEWKDNQ